MGNLGYHNTCGPEIRREGCGYLLPRIPLEVRRRLNPRARFIGASATGVEVRFVTEALTPRVTLSSPTSDVSVDIYRGDFHHSHHVVVAGTQRCLHLTNPDFFSTVIESKLQGRFSSDVWRVVFDVHDAEVYFHGVDTLGYPCRRPKQNELPALNWLAYGSSITNSNAMGYPHQAARLLGVDVMNKGLSGACHIEPELVDYLVSLDFDFATCELGVNMRGKYTVEEFEVRANYLIEQFGAKHYGKPLGIITPFPNGGHFAIKEDEACERLHGFGDVLRRLVASSRNPGIFLIEGSDLLDRFSDNSVDLLHPSAFGQIRMGMNLTQILVPYVEKLSKELRA